MSSPWTATVKDLTPNRNPEPPSNPPAGGFVPPGFRTVNVAPVDLFKSIARCSALSRSSASLIAALVASSKALLEFLVDDATTVIAFLDEVSDLADAERTALAGRMGAGVTDHTMDMLGFVWRDVAEELIGSSSPLADYVYEGATGTLVLAEAKGSISKAAAQSGANTRARNAYRRQVDPYVYLHPPGPGGGASVGLIEHGYAVAFSALPGPAAASPPIIGAAAFLAVAETDTASLPVPVGGTSIGGGAQLGQAANPPLTALTLDPTRFALRLGNYRGVFLLANAPAIVETIDAILGRLDVGPLQQSFLQVQCDGMDFLIGLDPAYQEISALDRHLDSWIFAIALDSARALLEQISNLTVPSAPPVLAQVTSEARRQFLLSPDGFAMLRRAAAIATHEWSWSRATGIDSRPIAHRSL